MKSKEKKMKLSAKEIKSVSGCTTFCPECGFNVPVDEDGCCSCGATAVGSAVDELFKTGTVCINKIEETFNKELIDVLKSWLKCADTYEEWMRCRDNVKKVIKNYEDKLLCDVKKHWCKDIQEESEVKEGWVDFYQAIFIGRQPKELLPCSHPIGTFNEYVTTIYDTKDAAIAARIPGTKYVKEPVKVEWGD